MTTMTKEWLKQKIADMEAARDEIPFGLGEDDSNTLAALRIALASLEAEPVAYIIQDADARSRGENGILRYFANISDEDINEYDITVTPLYTAPPTPVSVPDALADGIDSDDHPLLWSYNNGWNACRAAMLQGAENAESRCTIQAAPVLDSSPKNAESRCSNSPVIPDGWVACSERMPEAGDDMIVFTDEIVMSGISYSKKKGFYIQALEYDDDEPVDNVTHWMPLPAAPQQEAK